MQNQKEKPEFCLIFWCGYHCNSEDNKPKIYYDKTIDEFTVDNGYDEEEILDIMDLGVGDEKKIYGMLERMSVYRYK